MKASMGDWAWSHVSSAGLPLTLSPPTIPLPLPGAPTWREVGEAPRGVKDGSWGPRRDSCPWWSQGVTRCNTRTTNLSLRSVGAPIKCHPDSHVSPWPHPAPPAMEYPFSKFQYVVNSVISLKMSILPLLFIMEHYDIIDIYVSSALRKIFLSVSTTDEKWNSFVSRQSVCVLFSSCRL